MPSRSFTDLFIRKPVIALVVNIIILVVGLVSYFQLNTRQYPRSDSAVVKISTVYFGASAETVRGYITTQLERVVASADGIDYIESESRAGFSTINVYLRLNYDTNAALAQISAKIDQVRGELPPEAEAPSISVETSDNQFASMYLSFYSDTLDQNQITDYLNRMVQPRLSAVKGVQRADVLGGRVFAMRAWLSPERLAAHGLSPADVRQALATNNALAAVGATKGTMMRVSLVANTDLRSVEEFRQLVVAERRGTIVRLSDVADVVLGAESYDEEVRFGGQTATFMGIWVLPSESTVEVIKRVRDAMPDIERSLPAGLKAKHRLRCQQVHRRCAQGNREDAFRDAPDRGGRDFPLHGVVSLGAHTPGGDAALARGGAGHHARVRLHHQPADPARDRARGRHRGRRRDRRRRERRTARA
jgi:multidrug efflux pump